MSSFIHTFANIGLVGYHVSIETDSNKSLPNIDIIGLPGASIKESKERIKSTFKNCGIDLPPRKFICNLSPSSIRKEGSRYDLPLAVSMFVHISSGGESFSSNFLTKTLFFGELGLDGAIKGCTGLLPSILSAISQGRTSFVVPAENAKELQYFEGVSIYGLSHFDEIKTCLCSKDLFSSYVVMKKQYTHQSLSAQNKGSLITFNDIKGHIYPKRVLTVAVSGMHNILMYGPPGSGKSLLAKSIRSLLPPLTYKESLEVSQIYSLLGKLTNTGGLISQRPFRTVHHTASKVSIVGGGRKLTPGEISLSHNGVLFFDEVTEFPRDVLEVLRQPLEDDKISISRSHGIVEYPANFMFVATMNPCPCGYYGDPHKECCCSQSQVTRYQQKISGPLLNRFDIILPIPREDMDVIISEKKHDVESQKLAESVKKSREIQKKRYSSYSSIYSNADITLPLFKKFIKLDPESENLIKDVAKKFNYSARVVHKLLKLARTIADLDGSNTIVQSHIYESIQYRKTFTSPSI